MCNPFSRYCPDDITVINHTPPLSSASRVTSIRGGGRKPTKARRSPQNEPFDATLMIKIRETIHDPSYYSPYTWRVTMRTNMSRDEFHAAIEQAMNRSPPPLHYNFFLKQLVFKEHSARFDNGRSIVIDDTNLRTVLKRLKNSKVKRIVMKKVDRSVILAGPPLARKNRQEIRVAPDHFVQKRNIYNPLVIKRPKKPRRQSLWLSLCCF